MGRDQRRVGWMGRGSTSAFTLVELLIAVGIVAVLSAASLPTLTGTIQGYRARTAAWQIASDLRLARAKAVSANRRHRVCFSNCGGPVPTDGYLIQREESPEWVIDSTVQPPTNGVQVTSNATITFAETGEANGGTVTLISGSGSFQVRTNFTGRVRVCPGSCP